MKNPMLKVLAVGSGAVLLASGASAAVDAAVTTALTTAATDAGSVAALVLLVVVTVFGFRALKRAIG